MPSVYIPSFQNAYPAPGTNAVPASAIAGVTIGSGLLKLSSGLAESAQTRKQLASFADAVEIDDPQTAALLRAQADSTPLISGFSGGGTLAGGRSRSGGSSGIGDALLESSLARLRDTRLQNQRLELTFIEQGNALRRIGASFEASTNLENLRTANDEKLKRIQASLDGTPTEAERKRLENEVKRIELSTRALDQADQELDLERKKFTAKATAATQYDTPRPNSIDIPGLGPYFPLEMLPRIAYDIKNTGTRNRNIRTAVKVHMERNRIPLAADRPVNEDDPSSPTFLDYQIEQYIKTGGKSHELNPEPASLFPEF